MFDKIKLQFLLTHSRISTHSLTICKQNYGMKMYMIEIDSILFDVLKSISKFVIDK